VRRQYLDLIWSRLVRGDFLWIATQGMRYLGTIAGERLGRPLTGPILATAVVTYRCNYRCTMCRLPERSRLHRERGVEELTTAEWLEVIRGLRRVGATALGITGGEPLLRPDIMEILRSAHDRGLITHLNTNGHLLSEETCARLLDTGVDSVNISLDGCEARIHDRIRGREGSFDRILEGVARLLKMRRGALRPRVTFISVLGLGNLDQARGMVDLAESLGVDRVGFLPVHEYSDGSTVGSILEDRRCATEAAEAAKALREVRRRSDLVDNSDEYLALFEPCFRGVPSSLRCYAPYTSLVVDCYGKLYPCVPFNEIDRSVGQLGNGVTVESFWNSKPYALQRRELTSCQACYWNCHTEMNLVLNRPPGRGRSDGGSA
jgi:radical SAM protein with 4Fe4S-binding SPASM domain